MTNRRFVVVGAGLQGCGIALELARRGKSVLLIERDSRPMNRASLRNEGKIHLGLIYAADRSHESARLQLQGALSFRSILRSWLGDRVALIGLSSPFVYLVSRHSLLEAGELQAHYDAMAHAYRAALAADPSVDYLGSRETRLAWPIPLHGLGPDFDCSRFTAAFETVERAIDTDDLAREITTAVTTHPAIDFLPNSLVTGISQHGNAHRLTLQDTRSGDSLWREADVVFNATWERRLEVDRLIGLEAPRGWLHRLKYRVIVTVPKRARPLPSATIVLGPFGDVVIRGSTAYCSWYPAGLQGWSHELAPPPSWDAATGSCASDPASHRIARRIHEATLDWLPGLRGSEVLSVDAGAIFAFGKSDVDQIDSELHDRSRFGVVRKGNFFSVDPGKLTTAPMVAVAAVEEALRNG